MEIYEIGIPIVNVYFYLTDEFVDKYGKEEVYAITEKGESKAKFIGNVFKEEDTNDILGMLTKSIEYETSDDSKMMKKIQESVNMMKNSAYTEMVRLSQIEHINVRFCFCDVSSDVSLTTSRQAIGFVLTIYPGCKIGSPMFGDFMKALKVATEAIIERVLKRGIENMNSIYESDEQNEKVNAFSADILYSNFPIESEEKKDETGT